MPDGNKAQLMQVAHDVGLKKRCVVFTGYISDEELIQLYNLCKLYVFPSWHEGFGLPALEAMACGLPCIVANNGGIGEYVTPETGFSIEPKSREYLVETLTEKITTLIENKPLLQKMSAKCYERVEEFEWNIKAKKIVEIYEKSIM